jgi:hypothetical protein
MAATLSWLKLPIVGMPGTECGRMMQDDGTTVEVRSFKEEFGPCDEDARWSAGMLLLCQKHAGVVAEEVGDDITEIESAWREECL